VTVTGRPPSYAMPGWATGEITERLGFTDRRAAHRGVARGLAEPAADETMHRPLALHARVVRPYPGDREWRPWRSVRR
jgi:hypothetical protein